jgi:hypothetical protein
MGSSSSNGNPNRERNGLTEIQLCYAAALIYGLSLIDEKASERGELFIPVDLREKCRPEIDYQYLRDFVQTVRIAKASHL